MATIYDLPAKTLCDQIFPYIHYTERLTIERTCQMFQNCMPYNDIKQLALNDPIFESSIHFAKSSSEEKAVYAFKNCGQEIHEVFANRLKQFLTVLLAQKSVGPRLQSIHLYRCVVNADSMRLIGIYCTNLNQRFSFEDMLICDRDAVLILPTIRCGTLQSLQLMHVASSPSIVDENDDQNFNLISVIQLFFATVFFVTLNSTDTFLICS